MLTNLASHRAALPLPDTPAERLESTHAAEIRWSGAGTFFRESLSEPITGSTLLSKLFPWVSRLRRPVGSGANPTDAKLRAFAALGLRLSSARTQREAIQIILDIADRFFGWDACTFDSYSPSDDQVHGIIAIDRVDGARTELEPRLCNAPPTARMRKVILDGPKLTLRQEPIQMPGDSVPMGDRQRPSASLMDVPVRIGGRVVGLFSIQSYRLNAYTEADLELLQSLADHAAGALERIQAEEKIKALNTELEDRIQMRTAELKATVHELESISYSLSHDLRAPLRAMQGYADLLLERYSGSILDGEAAGYLSRISRSAVRLDSLIQDVLSYSKVVRADAAMRCVELHPLIHDLIEMHPDWQAPRAVIHIESALPAVFGNEGLLTQCIANLIQNAVKFVPRGTSPTVRIWAETDGAKVSIFVEDNGIGIASENHGRVFRLFERINPSSEFEGTGLGLAIARKAAERMKGSVGFTSELGKGSKFWIQLPIEPK